MKQYIVDAFADELFTGNPAAVLPCMKMPDADLMLKIAIENNYSETAFVVKRRPGHRTSSYIHDGLSGTGNSGNPLCERNKSHPAAGF